MKKVRGRGFDIEIMNKINDFAKKHGLKLFPKTAGLTFEKERWYDTVVNKLHSR